MKRVALIEYQGRCDTEGNAVGHAPKVLGEYYGLLKDRAELTVYAPETILRAADKEVRSYAKQLPHRIVMKSNNSVFEKIANKFRMFANIRGALLHAEEDVLWFFNVEFYLMLYLSLFGNHGRRIFCTLFQDGWHGSGTADFKQRVFEHAQGQIERIMSTGPAFTFKNAESFFLPDYPYDEAVYGPYRLETKQEQAVCLGTMGAEKDIEGLVAAFTKNGYPLTIAGRFYDKERVSRLKETAGENITIRDDYLEREEYLRLMARAAYCILPYSSGQYRTQTSGVMQEAMFLNTIPVAPEEVLQASGIPGLAAAGPDEVTKEKLTEFDRASVLEEYRKLREEVYGSEAMQKALEKLLEENRE